jgi:hypothetical protein
VRHNKIIRVTFQVLQLIELAANKRTEPAATLERFATSYASLWMLPSPFEL